MEVTPQTIREELGIFLRVRQFKEKVNQHVVIFKNASVLISYDSIIVVKFSHENTVHPAFRSKTFLGEDWKYSTTTSKFRNIYLGNTTKDCLDLISSGQFILVEGL